MRRAVVVVMLTVSGTAVAQAPPEWDKPDPCATKRVFINGLPEYAKKDRIGEIAECEALVEQRNSLPAIKADKKQMAIVFGSIFCALKFRRQVALDEIAKEKKYAKVGGMVDKAKLYGLQKNVRSVDEREATVREKMKQKFYAGVVPAACSSPAVKKTLTCHDNADAEGCGPREAAYNVFVAEFIDVDEDE